MIKHTFDPQPDRQMATPGFDPRAAALAIVGVVLREFSHAHQGADTPSVLHAAADILDEAHQVIAERDHSYHNDTGDDGLTAAERDAGYTPELKAQRAAAAEQVALPAIALHPGNDQLAVLAALHADGDVQEALRNELGSDAPSQTLARIAEHYPGVANELRAYVTHPDRDQAAAAAGGQSLLTVQDDTGSAELPAVERDSRVPGGWTPPDTSRDTSGDVPRLTPENDNQEQGRTAHNLGAAGVRPISPVERGLLRLYESNPEVARDLMRKDPEATRIYQDVRGRMQQLGEEVGPEITTDNGELPELASAPALSRDDGGHIREEEGGGAIQEDKAGGAIAADQDDQTTGRGADVAPQQ